MGGGGGGGEKGDGGKSNFFLFKLVCKTWEQCLN